MFFRELGSTDNYFKGAGEQAHSEPCQKVKNKFEKSFLKGNASILFDLLKNGFSGGGGGGLWSDIGENMAKNFCCRLNC